MTARPARLSALRCLAVLVALPSWAGCAGDISSLGNGLALESGSRQSRQDAFTCKDDAPSPSALHRLSHTQYENTVHGLLEAALPSHFQDTQREVDAALALLPDDAVSKSAPFSTMDQSVSQQHVDGYFAAGQAVATALTADDARVDALLACQSGESDDACVQRFIERFARRAFRHTASDAELALLNETYAAKGIDVDALRDVITLALNAPQFLYQVEFGGKAVSGKPDTFEVKGTELAARLALHLWQAAPDDELLARAESGELERSYEGVVDDMLEDPRSQASTRAFVREWLNLDELRPLDSLVGNAAFDAFVGKDTPSSTLRDAMVDEVLDSFQYHLEQGDAYPEWFTSPYSFARGDELAALYGVPKWSDDGREPPRFATGERAGLLTRAALLATGTTKTRPIMKGVFIRERILCDVLPPPPANATSIPASLANSLSTREVVEQLTEQPKSSCASCHATRINPLGFATENYDALGRLRTKETLYGEDGSILAVKSVDTASVPDVEAGDTESSRGAADLMEQIVASGKGEACFARQYIRFAQGRMEDETIDGCTLEAVRTALQDGKSLRQALRAPVLSQAFRQRYLGDVR
jgi:Protein of unknown function (DUF1588)/Protein of unknown function (DUF1592)/Protein of unknown function (DUF1595)/Protein of unknown function (DUF1587)/Protein of unknown function (DUF1585)